jgi:hypothetical protein
VLDRQFGDLPVGLRKILLSMIHGFARTSTCRSMLARERPAVGSIPDSGTLRTITAFFARCAPSSALEARRYVWHEEPAYLAFAFAPAHEEPRSGSNNSERESTSGRSTNYVSGHLILVFRDIGRIFSLLVLLSRPLPVGHTLRGRRFKSGRRKMVSSKAKKVSIVFRAELTVVDELAAYHSPKREPRPSLR